MISKEFLLRMPSLRRNPAGRTVTFDEIMDALKELDEEARRGMKRTPSYRRLLSQRYIL